MQKETLTDNSIRRFRNLLIATATMTFLLIVMGGIVRVTGSGLGCPDWPRCFGQWIPPMRVDAIIEYMHRLIATLTSPLILASAVVGWRSFRHHKLIVRPLIWVVVLLGVQGLLGGIVVLLETPPDLVAVHLGNALLILALIILPGVVTHSLLKGTPGASQLKFNNQFAKLSLWILLIIFVVLVSGAIVAGSNATEACTGWPLCNGQLIPSSPLGWVHMAHRAIVGLATFLILFLLAKTGKEKMIAAEIKFAAYATVLLFFTQALIGALKVSTRFPIYLLGLHVAVAAAVWAAAVILASLLGLSAAKDQS